MSMSLTYPDSPVRRRTVTATEFVHTWHIGVRVSWQPTRSQTHSLCHGHGEMKDQRPSFLSELNSIRAPSVLPNG